MSQSKPTAWLIRVATAIAWLTRAATFFKAKMIRFVRWLILVKMNKINQFRVSKLIQQAKLYSVVIQNLLFLNKRLLNCVEGLKL